MYFPIEGTPARHHHLRPSRLNKIEIHCSAEKPFANIKDDKKNIGLASIAMIGNIFTPNFVYKRLNIYDDLFSESNLLSEEPCCDCFDCCGRNQIHEIHPVLSY
jgi:hypothetical protein